MVLPQLLGCGPDEAVLTHVTTLFKGRVGIPRPSALPSMGGTLTTVEGVGTGVVKVTIKTWKHGDWIILIRTAPVLEKL